MTLITDDRIMESSTTTGTGAFSLSGAYTGYRRFSAVCSVSDTVYYCIEAIDANGNPSGEWETGLGTYSSANTLTRTSVHKSSNSNNAVDFSAGTKRVMLDATAALLATFMKGANNLSDVSNATTARGNLSAAASGAVTDSGLTQATSRLLGRTTASSGAIEEIAVSNLFALSAGVLTRQNRGALVKKSADQTGQNFTSITTLTWNAEEYDTDGFHDTVSNTDRLTVPSGVTMVKVGYSIAIQNVTADNWINVFLQKNGSASFVGRSKSVVESGVGNPAIEGQTPAIVVTAGDYFNVAIQLESDTSVDVLSATSCFWIEVVEGS